MTERAHWSDRTAVLFVDPYNDFFAAPASAYR
jgi:hypothetical protein